jgi:Lrp/AsnC family leucine-responsive transcriptional regulator
MMDNIDIKIARHLMTHGRASWTDLAALVGLSGPAVADRVRRLEEQGIVRGYAALLDPAGVGCDLLAFIAVTLHQPEQRGAFLTLVVRLAAIQECHHVAGDYDFLLKVRCRTTRDLEALVSDQIKAIQGVQTRTTVILSTAKETPALPLPDDDEKGG